VLPGVTRDSADARQPRADRDPMLTATQRLWIGVLLAHPRGAGDEGHAEIDQMEETAASWSCWITLVSVLAVFVPQRGVASRCARLIGLSGATIVPWILSILRTPSRTRRVGHRRRCLRDRGDRRCSGRPADQRGAA
jgi:hypothetical protein